MDIVLGEESGLDLAQRLVGRANAGRTRVVLISTHAEEDFVELIEASPAVGFLSKSKLSGRALRELLGGSVSGGDVK